MIAHKRKRTGCLGCRERRKKCDERQPVCLACARKSTECVWPDNWKEPKTTAAFSGEVFSAWGFQERKCSADRCSRVCFTAGPTGTKTLSTPTKSQQPNVLSWEACNGRRSPGPEPVSSSSSVNGTQPKGPDSSESSGPGKTTPESGPARTPSRSSSTSLIIRRQPEIVQSSPAINHLPLFPRSPIGADNGEFQLLFQHFVWRSMPSMSVDHVDTQIYIGNIVPLALADDLVLRGVMALSGQQYALANQTSSQARRLGAQSYSAALAAMRSRVSALAAAEIDRRPEALATASLLLALTEATRGDRGGQHVNFASHVLRNMTPQERRRADPGTYRTLLKVCLFLRFESAVRELPAPLASSKLARLPDMPVLAGHLWEAEERASAAELDAERGVFQGPFVRGLLAIQHLARLQADSEDRDEAERVAQLAAMEMQLTAWEPANPDTGAMVRHVWKLWQLALLMMLYESPVGGGFWQVKRRDECFEELMKGVELVPRRHMGFSMLIWPILVAGACARPGPKRELINEVLTEACETLITRAPTMVVDLLNSTWETRSVGASQARN
ncbi:hypothetical protein CSOJ01_11997 [Colletotrichum sojae]|uniref:Zn(2)-C6 fungal-type domain-containing protein n=1 Tax=Colletotrichum sojae TaxID=2175907 RepID=A0A8H6IWR1_9PEZI|nr:hypothetical protein CSOJ01_11997 [Colletotrichum sojae]